MNGKGIGEHAGWYICDGRNGTSDLRGRFVIGRDVFNSTSSYSNIGMQGGLDTVALTSDEMPNHFHAFQAHTTVDGEHS
ncbi:unnamed protein product [Adineta ricciae]|uniref:Phage tail collar domain-containing protein n=1 Tax=Adineta ricciae TaxID=249248 RepID=A0A813YAG4_ADIRI|nr:unnamed protein product [Adineta ricciae]CAF1402010.1 unnamed protein product [Adineta ricciae]